MALTPGTRLGPYEVTAQLGVGGMGEVYRATDTNLKRQVAIKVLPELERADGQTRSSRGRRSRTASPRAPFPSMRRFPSRGRSPWNSPTRM